MSRSTPPGSLQRSTMMPNGRKAAARMVFPERLWISLSVPQKFTIPCTILFARYGIPVPTGPSSRSTS